MVSYEYGHLTEELIALLPSTPMTISDSFGETQCAIRLRQMSMAYGDIAGSAYMEACKVKYADVYQCSVCQEWKHVESMFVPGETEDLCCSEACCEAWNDRS